MSLHDRSVSILAWLVNLFNPPPLQAMNRLQKVGRVFLFSITLVVVCILLSMFAAACIFTLQHARHMIISRPELIGDACIIFVSMLVNSLCVMVLLAIRRADHKLVPPAEPPGPPTGK